MSLKIFVSKILDFIKSLLCQNGSSNGRKNRSYQRRSRPHRKFDELSSKISANFREIIGTRETEKMVGVVMIEQNLTKN